MRLKLSIIVFPVVVVAALFLAPATIAAAEGEEPDGRYRPAITQGNSGAARLAELLRIVPLPDGARDALLRAIGGAGFSGQGPGPNASSNGHGPRALCQQFAGDGSVPEPIAERCHRPAVDRDGVSPLAACRRAAEADDVPEDLAERCRQLRADHEGDRLRVLCRRAANADDVPERLIERCKQLHDGRDGFSLVELCRRAATADDVPERLIERCRALSGDHNGPHPCDRASDAVDDWAASIVRRCHDAPGQQRPALDSASTDRLPRPSRPTGVAPAAVDPAVN